MRASICVYAEALRGLKKWPQSPKRFKCKSCRTIRSHQSVLQCLQLAAAIPNFAIQEYATGFEAGTFESRPEHLGSNIVDKVPLPKDGFVDIPTGPGLGMNLLPDAQKIRPPLLKPISMRPHFDGFIVDQ